ncbi:MAG: ATP-binding cassette domain-containing protein [Eubacteriales bacterium]|nr:ATP-binding cassette domain-containing protein [Eubacteriales bacterium]
MINIEKSFPGVKALDNAQLKLRKGTVHALMGENGAGKSTLMKCLFGIYRKDSGIIRMEGEEINFNNPRNALDNGVAMVHQELNQVLRRNVMENIWLGRFPTRNGLIDHKKMYQDTMSVFKELEIDVNPKIQIGKLSVSKRQMVEIAKTVSHNAKILVLDEPTSSLTDEEVEHLFRIIRKLCDRGVGIVYISHKLDEIKKISADVTIMRDGQWIHTCPSDSISIDEIVNLMVNRDMSHRFPPKTNTPGDVLMEVKDLTGKYEPTCKNVSFELRQGEVLGVAGLVGSRRTELLQTIFGVESLGSGTISLRGKLIDNGSPKAAIKNGFAMITEERRATGLFPLMNLIFNSTLTNIRSYLKFGLLSNHKMMEDTAWVIKSMSVKTPGQKTKIKYLSGGNQQKVIIGRWLLTKPEVLLMDEPTRGIDVGAKYEIYQLILDLAGNGKGVIMVSSEMPELVGICDRILVMSNGHMSGILEKNDLAKPNVQELIMHLSAKYV